MSRHRSAKTAIQNGLRPLNPREENFVREFLIDLNGAKAAQRAGYSARGARVTASRLLSKASVITALQQQRETHARRLEVTTECVLDELAICAFSDIG
jgi:phage terminase small subunit